MTGVWSLLWELSLQETGWVPDWGRKRSWRRGGVVAGTYFVRNTSTVLRKVVHPQALSSRPGIRRYLRSESTKQALS